MDDRNRNRQDEVFSKRIRAGRKRTYFIDVKSTRNEDFYLTITESKKDFRNPNVYIKHKIFLYKEDFNKFLSALTETIDHVKKDLLPDFPFDLYDREHEDEDFGHETMDMDLHLDDESDQIENNN